MHLLVYHPCDIGAVSLRGTSRALETFFEVLHVPGSRPSWSADRLWLLRLGYYKLMRPKVQAEDWVWIIDPTVQWGDDKGLVILGMRWSDGSSADGCLHHTEVEPIVLAPVKKSNGEVVYQPLEQAGSKTGVPCEIISDHGAGVSRSSFKSTLQPAPFMISNTRWRQR